MLEPRYDPWGAILSFLGRQNDIFETYVNYSLICAGALVAYGLIATAVWYASCKGQRRTDRTVAADRFTGDLRPTTLFGCYDLGARRVAETLLCPVCVLAENVEQSLPPGTNRIHCGIHCGPLCGLVGQILCQGLSLVLFMPFCWWYVFCSTFNMRSQYGQELHLAHFDVLSNDEMPDEKRKLIESTENCCVKCLTATFCFSCSNMQVAEFRELHERTFGVRCTLPDEETGLLEGRV
jgi:hypothetical protein